MRFLLDNRRTIKLAEYIDEHLHLIVGRAELVLEETGYDGRLHVAIRQGGIISHEEWI